MDPRYLALFLSFFLSSSFPSHGAAQPSQQQPSDAPAASYQPRIAIVIGIFSIMLSVTFLLAMYAKFCHAAGAGGHSHHHHDLEGVLAAQHSRSSGVDKAVIESLPFFRFSSLRGSREGLECAVCLSPFEGAEVLRLLPKCNHAFHIACVDRWLESHSTCPLCRHKVEVEDPLSLFKYSTSSRFLLPPNPTSLDDDLELYVEREPALEPGPEKKTEKAAGKEEEITQQEEQLPPFSLHRHKHRIVVSDVVFKNRWSDLNTADLVSLNSQMLGVLSSQRFDLSNPHQTNGEGKTTCGSDDMSSPAEETIRRIKEEMEKKRVLDSKAGQMKASFPSISDAAVPPYKSLAPSSDHNHRSMSEIVDLSRFARVVAGGSRGFSMEAGSAATGSSKEDDKVRRVWLPIARRTVQWLAGREKRSEAHEQLTAAASNV